MKNFLSRFATLAKLSLTVLTLFLGLAALPSTVSAGAVFVTLTSPNGGEIIGGTHTITWTCTDDGDSGTGTCSSQKIQSIQYSADGGTTVVPTDYVADSLFANAGSYSWDSTANIDSATAKIEITANGFNTDQSDADFILDNTAPLIDTATTGDADSNGFIDQITLTFIEASSGMDTSETSTTGLAVVGHTLDANGAWNGSSFTFGIDETADQTDATPNVTSATSVLKDLAGNALVDFGATPAIKPSITDFATPGSPTRRT